MSVCLENEPNNLDCAFLGLTWLLSFVMDVTVLGTCNGHVSKTDPRPAYISCSQRHNGSWQEWKAYVGPIALHASFYLLWSQLYMSRNWGLEKLSNFPKSDKLLSSKAGVCMQVCVTSKPVNEVWPPTLGPHWVGLWVTNKACPGDSGTAMAQSLFVA